VLFCDLRGFSAKAEKASGDLVGLLERVSQALGVMTKEILAHNGVTGDFLGDAALGFWGWPFRSDEAPLDACRAALAIRKAFADAASNPDHPLRDFRMGIGIAHGPAVAGKIGTPEQVKFTVFGPIVNLASRLEGMTKQLRVPILIDEATAEIARTRLPRSVGRTRQLARVLPYGSERPLTVSELLPSQDDLPELSDADLETYEAAFAAFSAGKWDDAYRMLHRLPPEDRAPDFLNQLITSQNRIPPPGWDGVVKLPTK
nr:adenylate/guanylate cyclase domain-containing protein [Planctomycetota bacterium]